MAMTAGARLLAGGGVAAVVVAVGVAIWGPPKPVEPVVSAVEPAVAAPETTPAPVSILAPEAPRFDLVRADGAGMTTIAGSGAPDADISLRVDGVEALRLTSDAAGQFAGLLTLPPSEVPRVLSLVMLLADGEEFPGKETVVLAPMPAPAAPPVVETTETVVAGQSGETPPATPDAAVAAPPAVSAEAPAVLLVQPEGVKVLQGDTAANARAAVQIDSIAYAPDGAVLLGGRGATGAVVRLYLDEVPLLDVTVAQDGTWQTRLGEVAPGLHTLRADQLGADGKVTARFETPFKREATEALAALLPAISADAAPAVATEPAPEPAPAAPALAEPTAEPAPVAAAAPVSITVQPGFTLWGIAETTFGDGVLYVQVFEANKDKIKNPDLIYPGQIFTVPAP